MPFCPKCGKHIEDIDIIYCPRCGTRLVDKPPQKKGKGRGGRGLFEKGGPLGKEPLF